MLLLCFYALYFGEKKRLTPKPELYSINKKKEKKEKTKVARLIELV
jgi:hypothetical protein